VYNIIFKKKIKIHAMEVSIVRSKVSQGREHVFLLVFFCFVVLSFLLVRTQHRQGQESTFNGNMATKLPESRVIVGELRGSADYMWIKKRNLTQD
jgi:hypothetical protein